jgi:hypothetical protein
MIFEFKICVHLQNQRHLRSIFPKMLYICSMLKPYLILIVSLFALFSSCDKTPNYPKNSVLGTWRCIEEGATYGFRQYNVDIDLQAEDSSMIRIYNFYNIGFEVQVYASIQDTTITILGTDNFLHDFSGTGRFERDYSAIYWEFSYFGQSSSDPQVEAVYRRP